jgi:hypothetical protein
VSKRGSPTGLRRWLALWLVGLVLAVSGAPCSGIAAPQLRTPAISAPADPCQSRNLTPAQACAQIACQVMLRPFDAAARAAPVAATLPYRQAEYLRPGRRDPPPYPPPRLPMS